MGTTNNHLSIINNHLAFCPLHLSRTLYKSTLFMQNKANLRKAKMNISSVLTVDYENKYNWTLGENKPNSNPIQTQYEPNQSQSNPISLLPKSSKLPLPTLCCAFHNTRYTPDTNEKAPLKAGLKRLYKRSYASPSILSAVLVQQSVYSLHL